MTFWTKCAQKKYFRLKIKKIEHHHWTLHIRISQGAKYQLKLIFLTFWAKFAEKGYFQWKSNCIFELVQVSNFTLNWQFWHFGPIIYQKRAFLIANGISERHHWILHIRVSLGVKFHLKLTILSFWTNFVQKSYFRCRKRKKWTALLNPAYSN